MKMQLNPKCGICGVELPPQEASAPKICSDCRFKITKPTANMFSANCKLCNEVTPPEDLINGCCRKCISSIPGVAEFKVQDSKCDGCGRTILLSEIPIIGKSYLCIACMFNRDNKRTSSFNAERTLKTYCSKDNALRTLLELAKLHRACWDHLQGVSGSGQHLESVVAELLIELGRMIRFGKL